MELGRVLGEVCDGGGGVRVRVIVKYINVGGGKRGL